MAALLQLDLGERPLDVAVLVVAEALQVVQPVGDQVGRRLERLPPHRHLLQGARGGRTCQQYPCRTARRGSSAAQGGPSATFDKFCTGPALCNLLPQTRPWMIQSTKPPEVDLLLPGYNKLFPIKLPESDCFCIFTQ